VKDETASTESATQWSRRVTAIIAGLAGSVLIWVLTPYFYFVIGTPYVGDCYLPVPALFVVLLLVLGLNPLLRWLRPRLALDSSQLAVLFGMMLVACVLPGQGLLRMLPYSIAKVPHVVRQDDNLARAYKEMDLPAGLFPDKIGFDEETPVADDFLTELQEGESVPWRAWLGPLVTWGMFVLASSLMMVGLAMIVLPQWLNNERLTFPLLRVERALIEDPEEGNFFAALFRKRSFWIAVGVVFVLHMLSALKTYNPEGVPAVPLDWNLGRFFTEEPLRYLPGHIKFNRIYFIFLGAAFFMPNRIGFSVWFFVIAYAAYVVIGRAYFPPYHWATVADHRMGAMFPLAIAVLYLGRAHWGHVFRSMFRRAKTEEDRRDGNSGLMFVCGCLGMFIWLKWVGVGTLWALFYVWFGFMVSLLIARIVAETGMPFIRLDTSYQISLVRLAPISWMGPVSLYFSYVMAMLFPTASRVSCSALATHAIALDEKTGPRRQWRMAVILVGIMASGMVVCGAAHLSASYHHSASIDGKDQPVGPWGTGRLDGANREIVKLRALKEQAGADPAKNRPLHQPAYNQIGHIIFGGILAAVLQWLCLLTPHWPLHPVGLLMVSTFYSNNAWPSVFLGWLAKILILRYGGARLYRSARPVFIGLIMGEVLAAVVWALEPAVRVLLNLPYERIQILPW